MRIHKCWFCSSSIYPGHGVTFVRSDCVVFRFCRSKCFKLFKRRLNPRKIKWTKIHRRVAGKDLMDDPILQFEKRVHVPAIYDRDVLMQAIDAIPKVAAIKQQREGVFIADRILSRQEENKSRDLMFIDRYKRLLADNPENTPRNRHIKEKEEHVELN